MTTKLTITVNGDAEGVESYIPHGKWQDFVRAFAEKLYPDAEITMRGEARTSGGDGAYLTTTDEDDDVEHYEELDIINDAWGAACSDKSVNWVPYEKD